MNVQIGPEKEDQRQRVEQFDAATAVRFEQKGQSHGEQHDGEKEGPRHSVEQERGTHDASSDASEPKLSAKTAQHPVDGIGDRDGEQGSVQADAHEAEPGIGPRHQDFVAPAIGDPGPVRRCARKDASVWNGDMINDPVADLEMPPDIGIENAELGLKSDGSNSCEQQHERRKLYLAESQQRADFGRSTHPISYRGISRFDHEGWCRQL